MRLTGFDPPGGSSKDRKSARRSPSLSGKDAQQVSRLPELRFHEWKHFKPDPAASPERVAQRVILPDRHENAPPNVQKLIREIQFCYNRELYDLAVISCRTLFEVAVLEFLKKNMFPQLNTSHLLRNSLQFWVDSLCRWAPPMLLSQEICKAIREYAARIGQATTQALKASEKDTSSEANEEIILTTLHLVNLLFPAGAEHH